jgi:uncharacterized membrane protein
MASTLDALTSFLQPAQPLSKNIGDTERAISMAGGGALVALGLVKGIKDGSIGGWLTALVGGAVAVRAVTGHCPVYAKLGVTTGEPLGSIELEEVTTVLRPIEDVYAFFRNVENLPLFIRHLSKVTEAPGATASRWTVRLASGAQLEWDAELFIEEQNRILEWRSIDEEGPSHSLRMHLAPAPGYRGTEISLRCRFDDSNAASHLLRAAIEPISSFMLREDLRRLKQLLEAGEIPTTKGQPSGRDEQVRERLREIAPAKTETKKKKKKDVTDESAVLGREASGEGSNGFGPADTQST